MLAFWYEMEPVRHLDGARSSYPGSFRVVKRPIPRDDLDAWMSLEPASKRLSITTFDEVDGPVGLEIDQDRDVGLTATQRQVVDAKDARSGGWLRDSCALEAEQGVGANRHAIRSGELGSDLAAGYLDEHSEMLAGFECPTSVARQALAALLGEARATAGGMITAEAANSDFQTNRMAPPGQVSRMANVAVVDAEADRLAARTTGAVADYLRLEYDGITIELDGLNCERRQDSSGNQGRPPVSKYYLAYSLLPLPTICGRARSGLSKTDNGPAHRGEAIRSLLATPNLNLRLVALPAYSPDFNADEAIWNWVRDEVTRNTCLATKEKVREKVGAFLSQLAQRTNEVQQRCRTALQAQADALSQATPCSLSQPDHVVPTLASV